MGFFNSVSLEIGWLLNTKFSPDQMFGSVSKILKISDSFSHLNVADHINAKTGYQAGPITEIMEFSRIVE